MKTSIAVIAFQRAIYEGKKNISRCPQGWCGTQSFREATDAAEGFVEDCSTYVHHKQLLQVDGEGSLLLSPPR